MQFSHVPVHFELNPIAVQGLLVKYNPLHAKYQTFYPQSSRFLICILPYPDVSYGKQPFSKHQTGR
jgi:hypothetical protein